MQPLFFSRCATFFKGGLQKVPIKSDPIEVKVYINDTFMGVTPLEINLIADETQTIRLEKEGYATQTVILNPKVGAGWVILDVLAGLVSIIVDAVTGDWYHLEPKKVNKSLIAQ